MASRADNKVGDWMKIPSEVAACIQPRRAACKLDRVPVGSYRLDQVAPS